MYRKLSNGISWALHPFLLPLYMIGVLLTLLAQPEKALLCLICLLYTSDAADEL